MTAGKNKPPEQQVESFNTATAVLDAACCEASSRRAKRLQVFLWPFGDTFFSVLFYSAYI